MIDRFFLIVGALNAPTLHRFRRLRALTFCKVAIARIAAREEFAARWITRLPLSIPPENAAQIARRLCVNQHAEA